MWTSPWRVYTNPNRTKILPADDPEAVLLCGEWDRIAMDDAQRLGLADADGNEHSPRAIKAQATRDAHESADDAAKDGD